MKTGNISCYFLAIGHSLVLDHSLTCIFYLLNVFFHLFDYVYKYLLFVGCILLGSPTFNPNCQKANLLIRVLVFCGEWSKAYSLFML